MVILVRLFGFGIIIMGVLFAANTKMLKKYIIFWMDKKKIRSGGILATGIGVIFLIAASDGRLPLLITIVGIWSIIKGMMLITINQRKINKYLDWWLTRSVLASRILGVLAAAFGILLIYAA